ncbi:MAG: aquaporin [Gaiellaceae bacterium]
MEGEVFRRCVAEFVGIFALVFVGAGSVMTGGGLLAVAVAHGLILAIMVSAVGHISGAHFNPAVTFGFLVTRRIAPLLAASYWVAQLLGALSAAALLKWIYPDAVSDRSKLGAPLLNDQISVGAGFVLEAVLTFFLVWVVFATAADPRGAFTTISGFAIGLTIAADILIGGPLTGAAMNPARAFGPQLVQNVWSDGWIWYLGPLLGGGLAAVVYDVLYLKPVLRPLPPGPPETGLDEPRPGDAALR